VAGLAAGGAALWAMRRYLRRHDDLPRHVLSALIGILVFSMAFGDVVLLLVASGALIGCAWGLTGRARARRVEAPLDGPATGATLAGGSVMREVEERLGRSVETALLARAGRPGQRLTGAAQATGQRGAGERAGEGTLWDRLEGYRNRREAKLYVLVGVLILLTMLGIVLMNRGEDIGTSVVIIVYLAAGVLVIGRGRFFRSGSDVRIISAIRVPKGSRPAVESALDDMSLATGIEAPALYIIDVESLNACLLENGGACVTRGLIEQLDRDELGAVFAWLLALRRDLSIAGSRLDAFTDDAALVVDAEALRLLGDPLPMVSAWTKVLDAENRFPGWEALRSGRLLAPPDQSDSSRRMRMDQLMGLGGAAAIESDAVGR
jgi:hypothetical protein